MLVAFFVRVWGAGQQSFWYDEGFSVIFTQRHHVLELFILTARWDLNTPLYYVALKLWMIGAGDGEFAVRMMSALTGVAGVALAHRLASALRLRPSPIALLLVAVSPVSTFISQEARVYALAGALCLLSTLMLLLAIQKRRWTYWLAWCGAAILAFFTHVLCAIVGSAQLVVGIAASLRERQSAGRPIPSAQAFASLTLVALLLAYVCAAIWPHRAAYGTIYSASIDLGALTVQALASQFLPRSLPASWAPFAALCFLLILALTVAASLRLAARNPYPLILVSVASLALTGLVIFCAAIGKSSRRAI